MVADSMAIESGLSKTAFTKQDKNALYTCPNYSLQAQQAEIKALKALSVC